MNHNEPGRNNVSAHWTNPFRTADNVEFMVTPYASGHPSAEESPSPWQRGCDGIQLPSTVGELRPELVPNLNPPKTIDSAPEEKHSMAEQ